MAQLKTEAREMHLPLDRCKPYPGIPLRFDMEVARIGESIHVHGQKEPGTAVKSGDEYLIADGRRRLLGCRYSHEKYGSPTTYWARVHEDLDEVQIFTQAFVINDERKSLSLLEEVDYFREAIKKFGNKVALQIGVSAGRQEDHMKRVQALCEWIETKLVRLHKIEVRTEHRFKLAHLESLSGYRDDEITFYQLAAVAAARKINPSDVETNGIKSLVKYYAPWFEQEFPEYATEKGAKPSAGVDDQTTIDHVEIDTLTKEMARLSSSPSSSAKEIATDSGGEPAARRKLLEDVYFATCPYCGAMNPFTFAWTDSVVIFIAAKNDGNPEKEASVPESLYTAERKCRGVGKRSCGKTFKLVVSPKGKNSLGIATYKKIALPEPEKAFTGQILVWDTTYLKPGRESEAWLVVSGDSKAHFVNGKLVPIKE